LDHATSARGVSTGSGLGRRRGLGGIGGDRGCRCRRRGRTQGAGRGRDGRQRGVRNEHKRQSEDDDVQPARFHDGPPLCTAPEGNTALLPPGSSISILAPYLTEVKRIVISS